jgi:hypothetical protein
MKTTKIFAGAYWQDYRWFAPCKLEQRYDEICLAVSSAGSNGEAVARVPLNLLTIDGAHTIAHIENIHDALDSVLLL